MGYYYKFQLGTGKSLSSPKKDEIRDYFHTISKTRINEEGRSNELGTGVYERLKESLLKLSYQYLDLIFFAFLTYGSVKTLGIFEMVRWNKLMN